MEEALKKPVPHTMFLSSSTITWKSQLRWMRTAFMSARAIWRPAMSVQSLARTRSSAFPPRLWSRPFSPSSADYLGVGVVFPDRLQG